MCVVVVVVNDDVVLLISLILTQSVELWLKYLPSSFDELKYK